MLSTGKRAFLSLLLNRAATGPNTVSMQHKQSRRKDPRSRDFGGNNGNNAGDGRYWMFGLHAVRVALGNPARKKHKLILSLNAANELADEITASGLEPEISDVRRFAAPLDPSSVHQGAALETQPLEWGDVDAVCAPVDGRVVMLLDRVTDPHNVGAILRSAEVFGAAAVIAPERHSAPETGALAKVASGALERQPYLRVRNLSDTMLEMKKAGYVMIGLDGAGETVLSDAITTVRGAPVGLVLGAEGPGLRERTRKTCDMLARIPAASEFASLNVSNAAAVSLFAASRHD